MLQHYKVLGSNSIANLRKAEINENETDLSNPTCTLYRRSLIWGERSDSLTSSVTTDLSLQRPFRGELGESLKAVRPLDGLVFVPRVSVASILNGPPFAQNLTQKLIWRHELLFVEATACFPTHFNLNLRNQMKSRFSLKWIGFVQLQRVFKNLPGARSRGRTSVRR